MSTWIVDSVGIRKVPFFIYLDNDEGVIFMKIYLDRVKI